MDNSNISNTSTRRHSFPDIQEHRHSQLNASMSSHLLAMTTSLPLVLSTTTDPEYSQQEIVPLRSAGTIYISSDTGEEGEKEDDNARNEKEHHEEMTSILTHGWLPTATSTPLPDVSINAARSEREIENDLFNNIEQLVREFVTRRNRHYPCYRVVRITTGGQSDMEYFVTIIINRPTMIL